MTISEVIQRFGFIPGVKGNRFRSWWIVEEIGSEESQGNAEIGFLCIKSRDGGGNPIDMDAMQTPNCVGTAEDGFDPTYRYYYFKPLA
jgi:hypothetical protein